MTWPLAPIIEKLRTITKETGSNNVASASKLSEKTIDNILTGKHIPTIQQFASILTACKYELTLAKDNTEPIVIAPQYNTLLTFIKEKQSEQGITDSALEKKPI